MTKYKVDSKRQVLVGLAQQTQRLLPPISSTFKLQWGALITFCLLALGQARAADQILAQYQFGSPSYANATVLAASMVGSPVQPNPGVINLNSNAPGPAGYVVLQATPLVFPCTSNTVVASNSYFSFTLSANSATFNANSVTCRITRTSGTAVRGFVVRSSVDNYANNLAFGNVTVATPTFTNVSFTLPPSFQGLSTVTFRIYVYVDAATRYLQFEDITVLGTVASANNPFFLSASSYGAAGKVYAIYNKPVQLDGTYTVKETSSGTSVTVSSQLRGSYSNVVVLGTGPLTDSVNYTVTASDVHDLEGNMVYPNPASNSFTHVVLPATDAGAMQFLAQPADQTVPENQSFVMQSLVSGFLPYKAQWFSNGVAILNATNLTYTNLAAPFLNGVGYSVTVSNSFSFITSTNGILTVVADTTPPMLVGLQLPARVNTTTNTVRLTFTEPMGLASAGNPANYILNHGAGASNAVLSGSNVFLTLTNFQPGYDYTLTITNVADAAFSPNLIVSNPTNVTFRLWAAITNGVVRKQLWSSMPSSGNVNNVSTLLGYGPYLANAATDVSYVSPIDVPQSAFEQFGVRLSGYLVAPTNGSFLFHILADDEGRFYLSTNDNPRNLQLVVRYTDGACCGAGIDSPAPVALVAGQSYYMEAFFKEGTGGDYISVTWKPPGELAFVPIPATNLFFAVWPDNLLTITQPPVDVVVQDGAPAVFTVGASTCEPTLVLGTITALAYQWYSNNIFLASATNASYTIPIVRPGMSGTFKCITSARAELGSALGGTYTKRATNSAALSVIADEEAPYLVSAAGDNTFTNIHLLFSEKVTLLSATNLGNYVLDGGLTLQNAALWADGTGVDLWTSPQTPGALYTVTVSNIQDRSMNANLIVPNPTSASFHAFLTGCSPAIKVELFRGIGGGVIPQLTNNTKFINNTPDVVIYTNHFAWNMFASVANFGDGGDDYGARLSGLFTVPQTGDYKFYIVSDDDSDFYLNTNRVNSSDPAGKSLQAYLRGWNGTYGAIPTGVSAPIHLMAGQVYYAEGLFAEGGGGDGFGMAYVLATNAVPASTISASDDNFRSLPGGTTTVAFNADPPFPAVLHLAEVGQGVPLVLNASVTTTPAGRPLCWTWQRWDGVTTWTNIPGYDGVQLDTLQLTLQYPADDGAKFRVIVTTPGGTTLAETTINLTPDTLSPTVVWARADATFTNVLVVFSEPVNTNGATFTLMQGANPVVIANATQSADQRSVVLDISPDRLLPGLDYTLTVSYIADFALAPHLLDPNPTIKIFHAWSLQQGLLAADAWTSGYGGAPASALDTVIAAAAAGVQPNYRTTLRSFDWHTQPMRALNNGATYSYGWDNYAIRISGWFLPPLPGVHAYKFYGRGDDATRFFMNTNGADPAGKTEIARNDGCCTGYANGNVSTNISLTNGTAYYFEGWMTEGGGADLLQMTYVVDGAPAPFAADGFTWFMFPGNYVATAADFALYMNPDATGAPVSFTVDLPATPINLVRNGDSVTLAALAVSAPDAFPNVLHFQWQTSIDGGSTWVNQLPPGTNFICDYDMLGAGTNDTAQYYVDTMVRVIATAVPSGVVATSTVASVNVPDAITVVALGSTDGTHFTVRFDQVIDPTTATDPARYTIRDSGGNSVAFGFPVLQPDGRGVALTLDVAILRGAFTVEIGSLDPENLYGVNALGQAYFAAGVFAGRVLAPDFAGDIGGNPGVTDPILRGSLLPVTLTTNGLTVMAGGTGITNTADGVYFAGWQMWGDFDIHVHVPVLTNRYQNMPDTWARAGLVARVSTNANALNLAVVVTPPTGFAWDRNGANRAQMTARPAAGAATLLVAEGATNLWDGGQTPWVRLQRAGHVFTGSYSTNGTDWITLSAVDTTPFGGAPPALYVGLGTSSGNNTPNPSAGLLTAQYTDLYKPVAPTVAVTPATQTIGISNTPGTWTATITSDPDNAIGGPQWIKWLQDGVEIPGETTATLTLPVTLPVGVHTITALIGNNGGATPASATLIVSNTLPVVVADSFATTQNVALAIAPGDLLGNDSDPEGNALTFTGLTSSNAVRWATDFEAGLPAGCTTNGTSYVSGGVLHLTDSLENQNGGFLLPDFVGRPVHGFKASFNVRIGDLVNGGADGLSFFFGNLAALAFPSGAEEGPHPFNGLTLVLDNYDNNGGVPAPEAPALDLKWQSTNVLAHALLPKVDTGAGWIDVTVTLQPDGKVDVVAAGVPVHTGVQIPGYVPMAGRFGFAARTGGAWEAHWVDNLAVAAIIEPAGVGFSDPAPAGTFMDYASQAGGAVALSGGVITYTPAAGFSGTDHFYYLASDGQPGGTAIGTVTVTVAPGLVHGEYIDLAGCSRVGDRVTIQAFGIPGATYRLERTIALQGVTTVWLDAGAPAVAAPDGSMTWLDDPAPPTAFYRTRFVSGP